MKARERGASSALRKVQTISREARNSSRLEALLASSARLACALYSWERLTVVAGDDGGVEEGLFGEEIDELPWFLNGSGDYDDLGEAVAGWPRTRRGLSSTNDEGVEAEG